MLVTGSCMRTLHASRSGPTEHGSILVKNTPYLGVIRAGLVDQAVLSTTRQKPNLVSLLWRV